MTLLGTHTDLNRCGIYCIKNLLNEKCYIGSSKAIYYRLKRHYSELKHNRHQNQHLQNSFNKYGEENFIGYVIEFCDFSNLEEREVYNIDYLKPVYNKRTAKRDSPILQETKDKISNTLKNKYKSGELATYKQNHIWREVEQYDLRGNYIQTFPCIAEASRQLRIEENCIRACLNKKNVSKSAGGFQFKAANDPSIVKQYKPNINHKAIKFKNIQTSKIIKFKSISQAERDLKSSEKTFYRYFRKNLIFRGIYKIESIGKSN